MKLAHFHVGVQDLDAAKRWFEQVGGLSPSVAAPGIAAFELGGVTLVLDRSEVDVPITVAIHAPSCDVAHADFVARGAETLAAPSDKRWGVRSAYLKGPGRLTLEIEEHRA
jgi:hypothetical protein